MNQMSFSQNVFAVISKIPKGKVATYGLIAFLSGHPGAYRAVGNILHKNPKPIVIPCHRVVNSKGYLAKQFGFGGIDMQKTLLEQDGVFVTNDYRVDLQKYIWRIP